MSKPLSANPQRQSESWKWHREVFAMFGKRCYLCRRKAHPTDAAHVLRRSHLGPLRYASPRFGRPAHRDCHEKVDSNEIKWPASILRDAIKAHDAIAKIPWKRPA